eukprot:COSAG01_NODE_14_length_41020_cov_40.702133_13_plen_608_part_00
MCGVIGYIGDRDISSILLVGLERLSYRGYDSSGMAILADKELSYWKKAGKTHVLADSLSNLSIQGHVGIAHTRWATHGVPNDSNAHPHINKNQRLAIVHNGIIENYMLLKNKLIDQGYIFTSDTDSEVLAHLIASHECDTLEEAVYASLKEIEGSYAIAVIGEQDPHKIVIARKGSPLIVGLGDNEMYIASEINVLLSHTKRMIYLEDNDLAVVSKDDLNIYNDSFELVSRSEQLITWQAEASDKNNYDYFMLKEIYEQPEVIQTILNKYVKQDMINFAQLNGMHKNLLAAKRFIIQACGTSWHAGLLAKHFIEKYMGILAEVDTSSEFRYRHLIAAKTDIVLGISQSGETADTLACLREAKSKFLKALSFVNVKNSAMDLESDAVIFSHSGQEVGVASTKNFTAQITTLLLFSLYMGKTLGHLDIATYQQMITALHEIPTYIQKLLKQHDQIKSIADEFYTYKNFIFIGRGVNYASALEGSLKLKEISYIHSTAYPAGELKHGPIALIDENMPVVCLCPKTDTYTKMFSNLQEVKSRSAKTIVIHTEGDNDILEFSDRSITIPNVPDFLTPLLIAIPLQLLAYEIAMRLNCDVDKPRNLAKSVTVE